MAAEIEGYSQEELKLLFLEEYDEMLTTYTKALQRLNSSPSLEDMLDAYYDIFRVFHTLKGTGAFFPEYENLTSFARVSCEYFRDISPEHVGDKKLLRWCRRALSQLSSAKRAIEKNRDLNAYRFHPPPKSLDYILH